jgi:hypothetical protein
MRKRKMIIDEILRVIDEWEKEFIDEHSQILIKQFGDGILDDGILGDVGEALWDDVKRLSESGPHYYKLVERRLGKEYAELYKTNTYEFDYKHYTILAIMEQTMFPVGKVIAYNTPPLGCEAIRKFFDEANKRIENGEPKKGVEVLDFDKYPHSPLPLEDIGKLLDMNLFGYTIIGLEYSYDNNVLMMIRKTKDGETTNIDAEVVENFFKIAT